MSNSLAVNKDNFASEVEASELPVLVDFYAEWCGPCKMLGPVVDEIAGEKAGSLKVCKVNCDSDADVASRFNISSIPVLILFKDGQELDRKIGALSKEELLAWIDNKI